MGFTLTDEHITLLREMSVGWEGYPGSHGGAPIIDPKRPYGNSDVERDIAETLGWPIDEDEGLTDEQAERARDLHAEMEYALMVALQAGTFTPGRYRNTHNFAPYGTTYALAARATEEPRITQQENP